MALIARGDFKGLRQRIEGLARARVQASEQGTFVHPDELLPGTILHWCIMATPHTLFIAHLMARRLREHGWRVDIRTDAPGKFDAHFYIVICPQMFRRLPPPHQRYLYQMEQSVSSRWFTQDYLDLLEHSRGVLEYALVNHEFLAERKIAFPHVNYLPVGADPSYGDHLPETEKQYDVLFYGDAASSSRRRKLLDHLKQHFEVTERSEVFGEAMQTAIRAARVVINIHYYENALLETPRIQECLSLGVPVVSESAQDQDDYPEIAPAVRFFPEGDAQAMVDTVRTALEHPVPAADVTAAAEAGWTRFSFMFDRFLVGAKLLPFHQLARHALPYAEDADWVTLSLPETIARRRAYDEIRPPAAITFDGACYRPGWIGCGLSYVAMAHHALRGGMERITIQEDDAALPGDLTQRLETIHRYLDAHEGQWDVFAGLIADLDKDAVILRVDDFEGMRFVTLDRMTSTVFNIYNRRALQWLADWSPAQGNVHNNTVDRYLGSRPGLRVVVTLPFLASLREDLDSTLWGIGNGRYLEMIEESQQILADKVTLSTKLNATPREHSQ